MIDFAGLSHKVQVIHGSVGSSHDLFQESGLRELLMQRHGRCHFDAVFIDHDKAMYLDDLKVIESCGLLRKGKAIITYQVADLFNYFSIATANRASHQLFYQLQQEVLLSLIMFSVSANP